jgi:hypothetical protein
MPRHRAASAIEALHEVYRAGDDVSTEELQKAVEHMHGCRATFVESRRSPRGARRQIVWDGTDKVFDLIGHPNAKRAYAWSVATTGTRRRFTAVLGLFQR